MGLRGLGFSGAIRFMVSVCGNSGVWGLGFLKGTLKGSIRFLKGIYRV